MRGRVTVGNALETLGQEPGREFAGMFSHGSLHVEMYRPRGVDGQTPHGRDELYVIVAGTGYFVLEENRREFEPGEIIFVPAGAEHRFEDFSDDFATWVIFYGPEGGERS